MRIIRLTILAILCCLEVTAQTQETASKPYSELLQDFVDMRFGMFICYNMKVFVCGIVK